MDKHLSTSANALTVVPTEQEQQAPFKDRVRVNEHHPIKVLGNGLYECSSENEIYNFSLFGMKYIFIIYCHS